MITREEVENLMRQPESFRVEKTVSTTNIDKFCEAICAFANDLPDARQNGYLLLGVSDDGKCSGLRVTDELQKKIASIRVDGNILPMPVMNLQVFQFDEGEVLAVEVQPSVLPPVRYHGRTFVRIGPRKDMATREEEEILASRRGNHFPTMDNTPCPMATLDDLDLNLFGKSYLPLAVASELLAGAQRTLEEWLVSLRLYSRAYDCPTNAAILLVGKDPQQFMPGAYVQYVLWGGKDNASCVRNQRVFTGNLCSLLPQLDTFIDMAVIQNRPIPVSALREKVIYNYPKWAVRELLMNAIMHRDYTGNAPVRFYQYPDRIEIMNHGGLFGRARPENFPTVNDYRNPAIAAAMRTLGFVNMLNHGIPEVQRQLQENGNGDAVFSYDKLTVFEATVHLSESWSEQQGEKQGGGINSQDLPVNLPVNLPVKVLDLPENLRFVLEQMFKDPGITYDELATMLGKRRETIRIYIKRLKDEFHLIRRVGSDKKGHWEIVQEP